MRAFHSVYHLFKIATLALFLCAFGESARGMDEEVPPPPPPPLETEALKQARAQYVEVNGERLYWRQIISASSDSEGLYFFYAELRTKNGTGGNTGKQDIDYPKSPHVATGIPSDDGRVFVYSKFDIPKELKFLGYEKKEDALQPFLENSGPPMKRMGPATKKLTVAQFFEIVQQNQIEPVLIVTIHGQALDTPQIINPYFFYNPVPLNAKVALQEQDGNLPINRSFCIWHNKLFLMGEAENCTKAQIRQGGLPFEVSKIVGIIQQDGSIFERFLAAKAPSDAPLFSRDDGTFLRGQNIAGLDTGTKIYLSLETIKGNLTRPLFQGNALIAIQKLRTTPHSLTNLITPKFLRTSFMGYMPDGDTPQPIVADIERFLAAEGYSVGGGGGGGGAFGGDLGEGDADARMAAIFRIFSQTATERLSTATNLSVLDQLQSLIEQTRTRVMLLDNPLMKALESFVSEFNQAARSFNDQAMQIREVYKNNIVAAAKKQLKTKELELKGWRERLLIAGVDINTINDTSEENKVLFGTTKLGAANVVKIVNLKKLIETLKKDVLDKEDIKAILSLLPNAGAQKQTLATQYALCFSNFLSEYQKTLRDSDATMPKEDGLLGFKRYFILLDGLSKTQKSIFSQLFVNRLESGFLTPETLPAAKESSKKLADVLFDKEGIREPFKTEIEQLLGLNTLDSPESIMYYLYSEDFNSIFLVDYNSSSAPPAKLPKPDDGFSEVDSFFAAITDVDLKSKLEDFQKMEPGGYYKKYQEEKSTSESGKSSTTENALQKQYNTYEKYLSNPALQSGINFKALIRKYTEELADFKQTKIAEYEASLQADETEVSTKAKLLEDFQKSLDASTVSRNSVFSDPAMQWHMEKNTPENDIPLFLKIQKRVLEDKVAFSDNVPIVVHLEFLKDLDRLYISHAKNLLETMGPELTLTTNMANNLKEIERRLRSLKAHPASLTFYQGFFSQFFEERLKVLRTKSPVELEPILKGNETLKQISSGEISLFKATGGGGGDEPQLEDGAFDNIQKALPSTVTLDQILLLLIKAESQKNLQTIILKALFDKIWALKDKVKDTVLKFIFPEGMAGKSSFLTWVFANKKLGDDDKDFPYMRLLLDDGKYTEYKTEYMKSVGPVLERALTNKEALEKAFSKITDPEKSMFIDALLANNALEIKRVIGGSIRELQKFVYHDATFDLTTIQASILQKWIEPAIERQLSIFGGDADQKALERENLKRKYEAGKRVCIYLLKGSWGAQGKPFENFGKTLLEFDPFDQRYWLTQVQSTSLEFTNKELSRPSSRQLTITDAPPANSSGDAGVVSDSPKPRVPGKLQAPQQRPTETTAQVREKVKTGATLTRTEEAAFADEAENALIAELQGESYGLSEAQAKACIALEKRQRMVRKSGGMGGGMGTETADTSFCTKEVLDFIKQQLRELIAVSEGTRSGSGFHTPSSAPVAASSGMGGGSSGMGGGSSGMGGGSFGSGFSLSDGLINDLVIVDIKSRDGTRVTGHEVKKSVRGRITINQALVFDDITTLDKNLRALTYYQNQFSKRLATIQQQIASLESSSSDAAPSPDSGESDEDYDRALQLSHLEYEAQNLEGIINLKKLQAALLEEKKTELENEKISEIEVQQTLFLSTIMIRDITQEQTTFVQETNTQFQTKLEELQGYLGDRSTSSKFKDQISGLIAQLQGASIEFGQFMGLSIVQNMHAILSDLTTLNSDNQLGLNFITTSGGLPEFARAMNALTGAPLHIEGISAPQETYNSNPQRVKDSVWVAKTSLIVALKTVFDSIIQDDEDEDKTRIKELVAGRLTAAGIAHLSSLEHSIVEEATQAIYEKLSEAKNKLEVFKLSAFLNIAPSRIGEITLSPQAMLENVGLMKRLVISVTAVKNQPTTIILGTRTVRDPRPGGVLTLGYGIPKPKIIQLSKDDEFATAQEFVRKFNTR